MDLSYQQFFPTQGNENQAMQPLFGESQAQAQQQFYVFPPPSGGSLDSGYAGEDTNPFDENAYCQDFKINFAQSSDMPNVDTTAARFASYDFNANDPQAVGVITGTASDGGGSGVVLVEVAVQDPNSGKYYNFNQNSFTLDEDDYHIDHGKGIYSFTIF